MQSESMLRVIAEETLKLSAGYETEVMLSSTDKALTRFGDNVITQNISGTEIGLSVRLIKDGKMGKASTGNLKSDGIRRCCDTAKAALEIADPEPSLLPLVHPSKYEETRSFVDSTLKVTPEQRSLGVRRAVDACTSRGLQAAGIFSSGGSVMALANSNGLWACFNSTRSTYSLSAIGDDSSGWADDSDVDIARVDIDSVIDRAIESAVNGKNPASIDPGAYTVVFEPAAVADFLLFLGWEALNGLAYAEERSCFCGRMDQKVVGDNITIVDDAYNEFTPGMPFDFEGSPRQRVTMIENGVFRSTVHDRRTAAMTGAEPTGHAMPQPDSYGPMPMNMVMSPGDSSLDEMIASTEDGLLVRRLHYTNILSPVTMTLTGMTRDGFFRIRNGRIAGGLKNMRFTDSVLDMLSNVEALSRQLYKTNTFWGGGGTVSPAIKVNGFKFSSGTEN